MTVAKKRVTAGRARRALKRNGIVFEDEVVVYVERVAEIKDLEKIRRMKNT
jgi:hypothetical protein